MNLNTKPVCLSCWNNYRPDTPFPSDAKFITEMRHIVERIMTGYAAYRWKMYQAYVLFCDPRTTVLSMQDELQNLIHVFSFLSDEWATLPQHVAKRKPIQNTLHRLEDESQLWFVMQQKIESQKKFLYVAPMIVSDRRTYYGEGIPCTIAIAEILGKTNGSKSTRLN